MILTLICLFALAAISLEIAYHANLSYSIKKLLFLLPENLPRIRLFTKFKFWRLFLNKWLYIFIPILIIFFFFYYEINQLLNCPFCIDFWLSLGFLLLTGYDLLTSIALTGIGIVSVYIIQILANIAEK